MSTHPLILYRACDTTHRLTRRQGTQEFLAQQIQTISVVKLSNPDTKKSIRVMNTKRFSR